MKAKRRYAFAALLSRMDTYGLTDELCCAKSADDDTASRFVEAMFGICQDAVNQLCDDDFVYERDVAAELEFVQWLVNVPSDDGYLELCNEMGDMGFARRLNEEHYSIVDRSQWQRYRDKADADRRREWRSKVR